MSILKKLFPYLLVLILSLVSILPLLSPGFFPIHDDTQVGRVFEMTKALSDGAFPVRWVSDLGYGYGYPIFNYYDPLSYYIGGFIGLLGFDALFSTKLMMMIGIILSGLFMYLLSKEFWGRKGGIISALFYVYAPYHAANIYVRGAVAEFWAYSFLPLLFYGIYKVYESLKTEKRNSFSKSLPFVIIGAVAFAAIILSHNLTAMMVTPFAFFTIIFFLFKGKKIKLGNLAPFLSIFVLGFLLSAFYSVPAILELKYTNIFSQIVGGSDYKSNFVCLTQLWYSNWGFGGSIPGCIDGISFIIGKPHIFAAIGLLILSLPFVFIKKYKHIYALEKTRFIVILLSFLGFLISILLTLEVSKPIWDLFYPFKFLQYPWRFLMLVSLFSSFMAGGFLWISNFIEKDKKIKWYLQLVLFLLLIFLISYSYIKYFNPQYYLQKKSADYTSAFTLNWTTSRISDEYLPKDFVKPNSPSEIPDVNNLVTRDIKAVIEKRKTQEIDLSLEVYRDGLYVFPIAYFPSWKGYLDGKQIVLKEHRKGILISLPKGEHSLRFILSQTKLEIYSNLLSLSGILIVFAGIILLLKRKYDQGS